MKILIDTNVMISAALSKSGTPFAAYSKAVCYPNNAFICDKNVEELHRIFESKFPERLNDLSEFLNIAAMVIEIVPVPEKEKTEEMKIRDIKDRPIMRAAIQYDADLVLTGDKDFLESEIKKPKSVTPAEFLEKY